MHRVWLLYDRFNAEIGESILLPDPECRSKYSAAIFGAFDATRIDNRVGDFRPTHVRHRHAVAFVNRVCNPVKQLRDAGVRDSTKIRVSFSVRSTIANSEIIRLTRIFENTRNGIITEYNSARDVKHVPTATVRYHVA